MEVSLHSLPRRRDVVLEQIRILGLALRPAGLVLAVVLAFGTVVIGVDILGGGPGFDSEDIFPTALVSLLFPFAVWRGERRFGPAFLWTLPVDRRRLALARVFAGWVWFMAALAIFTSWLLVLALMAGVGPEYHVRRIPLVETIAAYLFGSAFVLGLRHPLRWLLGAVGVAFLTGNLNQILERIYGVQSLFGSRGLYFAGQHSFDFWRTLPPLAQFAISSFLLLGLGLAALWAAVSRHREDRHH